MDPIADMLVRIDNALKAKKETVDLPHSKMKEGIGRMLLNEGYIGNCEVMSRLNKKYLRLRLKYTADGKSIISGMRRASKPGRRHYRGAADVPRVQSGFGTAIISTSRGLMTDEQARAEKVGGEVVLYIW